MGPSPPRGHKGATSGDLAERARGPGFITFVRSSEGNTLAIVSQGELGVAEGAPAHTALLTHHVSMLT